MAYAAEVTAKAEAQLKALPEVEASRILAKLAGLSTDPRPPQLEQLSDSPPLRRTRPGNYHLNLVTSPPRFVTLWFELNHQGS